MSPTPPMFVPRPTLFRRLINCDYTWKTWDQETTVMLLGDAVHDEKFEWPDLYVKGLIVNIDELTC